MSDRHTVTPRTMCFVFYNNKVLMLKASDKKEWTGVFDPVGGHVEKGENIIHAAIREIKEETGLDVTNTKLRGIIHVSDFFRKNVMMFVLTSESPTNNVVSNEEGELEWIPLDQLHALNTFEDVKPILDKILEMDENQIFIGTSKFDSDNSLLELNLEYIQ